MDEVQPVNEHAELMVRKKTLDRLRRRAHSNRVESFDAVLKRLLDQTVNSISLTEFADRILETIDVYQIAVDEEPIKSGCETPLQFVVHTYDNLDCLFEGIQGIEVDGTQFLFEIRTSQMVPRESGRYILYAPDHIIGMEPVSREEGVKEVEKAVCEFLLE